MMTQTSSRSRIVTVWLVLLAFLCVLMVPSLALAKKEMIIATEGDPGDGMDYAGGGSGAILDGESNSSNESDTPSNILPTYFQISISPIDQMARCFHVIWSVQGNGQIQILVLGKLSEWGAIR